MRKLLLAALLLMTACSRSKGPDPTVERNRKFAEAMSGVTLVGNSTRWGREGLSKEERYRIDGVTHVSGDTWLFRTRLQYDGHDIPVPIPISVLWAGDTPVITLTDLTIPKAGTFTARVLIYRDQYAGTWSGGDHGGQLFGKVVRGLP